MGYQLRSCRRSKRLTITVSERLMQRSATLLAEVARVAIMHQHKTQQPTDWVSVGRARQKLVHFTFRVSFWTWKSARQSARLAGVCVSDYVEACCWHWLSR